MIEPAADTIGAPQMQMMGGARGGDIFPGVTKLFIKQEMAVVEIFGLEAKQRYRISVPTADNKEGTVFMFISEESGCFERICLGPNRSLTLKLHAGPSKDHEVIQKMSKPYAIGGNCPCCRPMFEVFSVPNDGNKLGTVVDPWACCAMNQVSADEKGAERFKTSGSPFQLGMCCACCAGVEFNIRRGGEVVGKVEKMSMDLEELFLNTNRFTVDFGQLTDPIDKRLALASAMLLDLQYFETQK